MSDSALNEVQMGLLGKGMIDLHGEVNSQMYLYIREALTLLNTNNVTEVTVKITSAGGDLDAALDIYDEFRHYPGTVIGQVMCQASSAAALVILQGCHLRQCARHASLVTHKSRRYVELEDLSEEKIEETRASMRKINSEIEAILCERTKKTVEEIREFYLKDLKDQLVTADEALAFGLIDEIMKYPEVSEPQTPEA
jgi:ATP-dependent protease ClpP protease subunit